MTTHATSVTCYNSIACHTSTPANSTRTVQPIRQHHSGTLAARTAIRYYHRPSQPDTRLSSACSLAPN